MIEKVLPNKNYVIRRINTNKTQFLHRIRLRQYNSDRPLDDSYQNEKVQRDQNKVIPQDDLYTKAGEFEIEPVFHNPIPYQDPNVIDSGKIIENNTSSYPINQKPDHGQILTVDPVTDHTTS